jgi:hypothetical protein
MKNAFLLSLLMFCYSTSSLCLHANASPRDVLDNGSFEADGNFLIVAETGWNDGPSLGNDVGFATNRWPLFEDGQYFDGNLAFEFPPGFSAGQYDGFVRPTAAGSVFGLSWGAANGTGRQGSATQIVPMDEWRDRPYEFSAWLASRTDNPDYPTVTLDFFGGPDASGPLLASVEFDGDDQQSSYIVGSLNIEGAPDPSILATQDNWTLYRIAGIVPHDARSAAATIRGEVSPGLPGFGNSAYVDLVSLHIVPEPASMVLLGTLITILAAVRCRMVLRRGWARSLCFRFGGFPTP